MLGSAVIAGLMCSRQMLPFSILMATAGLEFALAAFVFRRWAVILMSIASMSFAWATAECWKGFTQTVESGGDRFRDLFTPDVNLGYVWKPSARHHVWQTVKRQTVFAATYTIGDDGTRVTPVPSPGAGQDCALFLGDSFTFGHGLNDDQSLPFQFAVQTQNRYRVYNFGVPGWGPHQILAQLQDGRIERQLRCRASLAIISTSYFHIARVAGFFRSDRKGPRFRLIDGRLTRAGQFDDEFPLPWWVLDQVWSRSAVFRAFMLQESAITTSQYDGLYAQILREAEQTLRNRAPGIRVHVLYWDRFAPPPRDRQVLSRLSNDLSSVIRVGSILEGYATNPGQFQLHPADSHPNARANLEIARYLANLESVH